MLTLTLLTIFALLLTLALTPMCRLVCRGLPPIPAFGIGWLYPVCPNPSVTKVIHAHSHTAHHLRPAPHPRSHPDVSLVVPGTATNSRLWNWLAVPGLPQPFRHQGDSCSLSHCSPSSPCSSPSLSPRCVA